MIIFLALNPVTKVFLRTEGISQRMLSEHGTQTRDVWLQVKECQGMSELSIVSRGNKACFPRVFRRCMPLDFGLFASELTRQSVIFFKLPNYDNSLWNS